MELQVIHHLAQQQSHPLRILLVASGGCTALSLLAHPAVAQIDAVDINPAQLYLVELRRQIIQHLTPAEQRCVLGIDLTTPASDRLALYHQVRSHLPIAPRQYWDQHTEQIAFGVNRVGRFEQLFRVLAARFAALGLNPLQQPDVALAHPQWRSLFEATFERQTLIQTFGEAAVNYSMDRSFGEHFADVFAQALQRFDPHDNYFLTQVWGDRYAQEPEGIPPYLQATSQQTILHCGIERLHLHQGHFVATLRSLSQETPFDLIQFSNISDWMPVDALHQMLAIAVQCLAPGGALLGRRLNGDHHLATLMSNHVAVDTALSRALWQSDRSFFYREVVVGFARPTERAWD